MSTHPFLPLAWLLPGWLLRWAESVIWGACECDDADAVAS